MFELCYNGKIEGVFSSEGAAEKYAESQGWGSYSILPLGTFLETDIDTNE